MQKLVALVVLMVPIILPPAAHGQQERPADESADDGGAAISIQVAMVEYLAAGDGDDVRNFRSPEQIDAWMKELGANQKLLAVTKMEIAAVDGRLAKTQFGERAAIVTGRTRLAQRDRGDADAFRQQGFGGAVSTYQFEEIGTVVEATPRLRGEGKIVVDLQIEKSDISPLTPQLPPGEDGPMEVVPPNIIRIVAQSTLHLKNGQTRVAFRKATSSPQGMVETIVFVTATSEVGPSE
jgi:hypothetical protein